MIPTRLVDITHAQSFEDEKLIGHVNFPDAIPPFPSAAKINGDAWMMVGHRFEITTQKSVDVGGGMSQGMGGRVELIIACKAIGAAPGLVRASADVLGVLGKDGSIRGR